MLSRRIVNASPLVFLAREGLLDVLRETNLEVVVPEPVIAEIQGHGFDDPTVRSIEGTKWLKVAPCSAVPEAILAWNLGSGESSVLALALADPDAQAVLDDLSARRCAKALGIPFIGTLGLVIVAKQSGLIAAARPVVERLRDSGMYLSDVIIDRALAPIGE